MVDIVKKNLLSVRNFVFPRQRQKTLPEGVDSAESYRRDHDHISSAIDASIKVWVSVAIYSCFTILLDFGGRDKQAIKVPLAGIETSYTGFSIAALCLIGLLLISFHSKVSYWVALGEASGRYDVKPLPYFFNRADRLSKCTTEALFYWVPVLAVSLFMINVVFGYQGNFWENHPIRNILILYVIGPLVIGWILYLRMARAQYFGVRLLLWALMLVVAYLPVSFIVESATVIVDPNRHYAWW